MIAVSASPVLAAGGGFLAAGIRGDYFAENEDDHFSGTPLFSRCDDRIDFQWNAVGDHYPNVAGSNSYHLLAHNFSVRWVGQIMARFSETYSFNTPSAPEARLRIKPVHGKDWAIVVGGKTSAGDGRYAMTAGAVYDIELDYFHRAGPAAVSLRWSSSSTPQEVIEPLVPLGINGANAVDYEPAIMFADAMKSARIGQNESISPGATIDAAGWPTGDMRFILFHGQNTDVTGMYTMMFTGQAEVGFNWSSVTVKAKQYDPSTNRTAIAFNINPPSGGALQFAFTKTRRLPTDDHPTGITDISIMRPTTPGAPTSFSPETTFTPAYKDLISRFTAIRNMDYLATNGRNGGIEWTDRMKHSYSSQQGASGASYQGAGGSYEYAVELSNETGKDLWLNIPMLASDDYLHQLALALKYGFKSNGDACSASDTSPAYPPLNSNLKIYLEYSNEVWNWSFYQATLCKNLAQDAVKKDTADGKIINYDHINNPDLWARRWWILRTKEIGDQFRSVWGDAAMMSVVRPVFEFQYDNINFTAADTLQFLDNYFNNADGDHVPTPHPVNYFLYASGGGWYNSVADVSAPKAIDGEQSSSIQGAGSISLSAVFPAGVSAVALKAAQGTGGTESFGIYVDDQLLKPDWRDRITPDHTTYQPFCSGAVNLPAGRHIIRIVGSGNGTVSIKSVQVQSVEQLLKGAVQNLSPTARSEVSWSKAYGLHTVGYEGGFEIGGDTGNALTLAANLDPRVKQATVDTLDEYLSAGGDLPVVFNAVGGSYAVAQRRPLGIPDIFCLDTPKLQAYQQALASLPPPITNGALVPRNLDSTNIAIAYTNSSGVPFSDQGGTISRLAGWISWNILVPAGGNYHIAATTSVGGQYRLLVDEMPVGNGDGATEGSGTVSLAEGLHSIKIRSTGATPFTVKQVSVSQEGAPAAPILTRAEVNKSQATLHWQSASGAAGYRVEYGNATASYTETIDVGLRTSKTIDKLDSTKVYYFAVYAYDAAGRRSFLSNEIRAAARTTDPQINIDLSALKTNATQTIWHLSGFDFYGFGNAGDLQVQDGTPSSAWPGAWPSKVLFSCHWGNNIGIKKTDGGTFDLYSFDLDSYFQADSALITACDASGAVSSKVVNFNPVDGKSTEVPIILDCVKVARVEIRWFEKHDCGGGNRCGAIRNVVFNHPKADDY